MAGVTVGGVSREQRISAVCAVGCGVVAVGVPVCVAALWAFGSWEVLALVRLIPPDIRPDMEMGGAARTWQRVTGAAICLVPALLLSYGLLRARRSLAAFARGDFFGAEAVEGLRGYAAATFWAAAASVVSVPVLSVAISLANPPGHKELSLDLSGAQLLNLLGAAILWVIASAMARASSIALENEQFV
ncbi:MAG: DUF2975 domain-containing protein [Phenylobacterium sp.]|uniref:DUF2975 domain-containing protein n=1 Tax=Phenylobacterium sp. TaxID=1871053 RepID=UPI0012118854|nr:DUF2975 domain-containing protein [Phenylobacterium sp.]TAJ70086.1 MAG: DUF2975 domain-containing protein [Phenylobacterium sp.]